MALKFRRTLHVGLHGRDVFAIQHALKYHTNPQIRHQKPNGYYRLATRDQIKEVQRRHNLHVDGILGEHTWAAMQNLMARDGYAQYIWHNLPKLITASAWQDKLRLYALFTYGHRDAIHYSQQRPMRGMYCPPGLNAYMDCSEGVTNAYKCAGLPDPNGYGYNGTGNTSTLLAHGQRVGLSDLRIGDLILYANPWHVSMAISHSQVWSNGSEGGPYLLPPAYRSIYSIHRYAH